MVSGLHLLRPDKNAPVPDSTSAWIERTLYRSLIGCLNYLAVATRPDIAYAVLSGDFRESDFRLDSAFLDLQGGVAPRRSRCSRCSQRHRFHDDGNNSR
jgi:hypothetical protein